MNMFGELFAKLANALDEFFGEFFNGVETPVPPPPPPPPAQPMVYSGGGPGWFDQKEFDRQYPEKEIIHVAGNVELRTSSVTYIQGAVFVPNITATVTVRARGKAYAKATATAPRIRLISGKLYQIGSKVYGEGNINNPAVIAEGRVTNRISSYISGNVDTTLVHEDEEILALIMAMEN